MMMLIQRMTDDRSHQVRLYLYMRSQRVFDHFMIRLQSNKIKHGLQHQEGVH